MTTMTTSTAAALGNNSGVPAEEPTSSSFSAAAAAAAAAVLFCVLFFVVAAAANFLFANAHAFKPINHDYCLAPPISQKKTSPGLSSSSSLFLFIVCILPTTPEAQLVVHILFRII